MKQTAIDYLIKYIHSEEYTKAFGATYISPEVWMKAKEMEKEQITEAYQAGDGDAYNIEWSYDYYNETYGE